MTRQNGYADGSRKRRHSADPAKRAHYAKHRQARFARRFMGASAASTGSAVEGPQAVSDGLRQEIHSTLRPGLEDVTSDSGDAEKTQSQGF